MATHDNPKLATYRAKRDPARTPEPFGRLLIPPTGKLFVVQQHAARHLHFDLRLEIDGVLKSWAVPKGPSTNPADKRLAVQTEDHPLDYADFEGEIPPGNYGAGHVILWDRGTFTLHGDFETACNAGKLLFDLAGHKLHGRWTLVRLKKSAREWLLIKEKDGYAATDHTPAATSILSGLTVRELKNPAPKIRAMRRKLAAVAGAAAAHIDTISTRPMLATPGSAHRQAGWIWELKYDGYRTLAHKSAAGIRLLSRNGHDLSARFPEICQVLHHIPISEFVMDGELVVHDEFSRPRFALIQTRAKASAPHEIRASAITRPASLYCFDLLFAAGYDLRRVALLERKRCLKLLLPHASRLIYSEHVAREGPQTYATARNLQIEGVVGKRADSSYQHRRSGDWIKVRADRHGDFVVVGWSAAKSNPADLGALALAEYRGSTLSYVGHAGSGLNQTLRTQLMRKLKRLARKTPPVEVSSARATHWVRPSLVVEATFTEYTPAGNLRHPVIRRLRDDKSPNECRSSHDTVAAAALSADTIEPVQVTNPDKIFFPQPGYRKLDLVTYYRQIAAWMLPHLHDRPIVLTRFPDGIGGKSFYQRDLPDYVPDWIRRATLYSRENDKPVQYAIAQRAEDLAYLANLGTLPIHMWHSRVTDLDHPDWCVLDLDPKSAPFADVVTLALAIGELADEVALPAFVKTSGASGLHVLLPLNRQLTHDQSQTLGELLAHTIVARHPDIATVARAVRARQQKVYVDYLQNGHGRLIVAPFAVRAEACGSVSMPLRWHEVNRGLSNQRFHLGNAVARLKRLKQDPMRAIHDAKPDLERSLHLLAERLPTDQRGQQGTNQTR